MKTGSREKGKNVNECRNKKISQKEEKKAVRIEESRKQRRR